MRGEPSDNEGLEMLFLGFLALRLMVNFDQHDRHCVSLVYSVAFIIFQHTGKRIVRAISLVPSNQFGHHLILDDGFIGQIEVQQGSEQLLLVIQHLTVQEVLKVGLVLVVSSRLVLLEISKVLSELAKYRALQCIVNDTAVLGHLQSLFDRLEQLVNKRSHL